MSAPTSPTFRLANAAPAADADLLVVPVFEGEGAEAFALVDQAAGGSLGRAIASRELSTALFDVWWTTLAGPSWPRQLLVVGAGPRGGWTPTVARRLAAAATQLARQRRLSRLALLVRPAEAASLDRMIQAAAEGVTLAQHDTGHLKSARSAVPQTTEATLVILEGHGPGPAAEQALERGRILGESTNLARALGNEPSNLLTPRELSQRAADALSGTPLTVTVLDEAAIRERGMRLLLAVAQGSAEPPRVIVIEHSPPGAPEGPVLGLIGKGVTFDTGGISIKPADGMERMKVDMAGGAAVIGAMRALALLGAPIRVIGVIPATENMPGGRAIKPGDVVSGAAGKTVEIVNTDAEGRLILADALWLARDMGATHLVDVATLTGACVIALGRVLAGLFGQPAAFVEAVRATGEETGDRCWPMPTGDEYFDQLKSDTADMTNTGGRPGGAVTAAVFLKQFAGGLPWAHLDIAGIAWSEDQRPYQPLGATGAATRLLAELALAPDAWR